MMKENMWVASLNGEEYDSEQFETEKEAIEHLKELEKEEYFDICEGYIGQVEIYIPFIDIDYVIDRLSEESYEDSPEWGGEYLTDVLNEHKKELGLRLNNVLSDWIIKHNYHAKHFKVKNSKKITIK